MSELWVDTDLGFDDLHALLLLRCHGVQPVGYSLVYGCATLDQVISNATGIERAFNLGGNWHAGAAHALDGQCRTAAHVLGDSGMRSRGGVLPQGDAPMPLDFAVAAMIDWLSNHPVEPQVLALGPLTNIAQLILDAPQIASRLARIVWMGGSAARGNQTVHAEFNAWADAKAAAIVMQSGIRVHMVELEACRKLQLIEEDLKPLSTLQSPTAKLLGDLLGGYLDIGLSRGRSGMALYDPLAAAVFTHASETILSSLPVHISVDATDSEQMGRTHIEPSTSGIEPVHSLCVVEDKDAVHAMLVNALYKSCSQR